MLSTWLPPWLGVAWALAFTGVALVHTAHLVTLRGAVRWWHVTHLLTAAGMVDMLLPGHAALRPRAGEVLFAAAAAAVMVVITGDFARGRWTSVWPIAALDLAAMACMVGLMSSGSALARVLALPLASWFVVEAGGWASGALVTAARRDFRVADLGLTADALAPPPEPSPEPPSAWPSGAGLARQAVALAAPAVAASLLVERHRTHARSIRLTLTVMALGMAYAFAALAFGHGGGMSGMSGG